MQKKGVGKHGQVTIFVIIAIVIVVGAILFFVFRDSLIKTEIPVNLEPVYNKLLSCLQSDALVGIDVMESQGGYITLPEFESGSEYMPFSSQLNFLGNPVPYWYYVSGNNVVKEQVPTKAEMEEQLATFVEGKIPGCVFDEYYAEGYNIYLDAKDITADVVINQNTVDVSLKMGVGIEGKDESVVVNNHKVSVNSNLGSLYDNAKKVYNYEQSSLFLENYGIDTLRNYAPVDGVEMTCGALTWSADEVFDELENAIEVNTIFLKTGGEYSLNTKENKYYVVDAPVDSDVQVRYLNSVSWPNSFEVSPSDGAVLIASPVGNQPGLGIMGFCYVPYHFVYDMKYPVLVQVSSGEEIFQFPLAVVIRGNKPREPLETTADVAEIPEFCVYKNTATQVKLYDNKLNPVDGRISYKCAGTICSIGETDNGVLETGMPQCVNGFVVVKADGFEDTNYLYSTTSPGTAEIILDKVYELPVELKLDGADYNKPAIVSFVSDKSSKTIIYPDTKKVELSEGQYEVKVYVYRNSNLQIAETTTKQCTEVPQGSLGGLFGFTEEKCFDITIPAQIVSNALAGGGKTNYYILESELQNSNSIEIDVTSLPTPTTLEQLQINYDLFEDKNLDVYFK